MTDPRSDKELLRAWLERQDHGAFSVLVARYQARLEGVVAATMRGNPLLLASVDDVVQDVFIRLAKQGKSLLNPDQSLAGWLICVASTTAIDVYRREKNKAKPGSGGPLDSIADTLPARLTDHKFALERCLDDMELVLLLPLHLKHWEGMKGTEIAEVLEVANATVTARLQRAEAWLVACIQRWLATPSGGRS